MKRAMHVDSLGFTYRDRPVFNSISFEIRPGESVALLGRNGSGKTTLIKVLCGLLQPRVGTIAIMDTPVVKDPLPSLYVIFSEPDDQIVMSTVYGELALGLVQQGKDEDEINRIIVKTLAAFDLSAYTHTPPHELSSGEKKRLLLATAMSLKPQVLILDEPFAGLDVRSKNDLVTHIASISATKLIVTHEYSYAQQCCQRALVLHNGQLHDYADITILLNDQERLKSLELI